jgi:hypothetical protein
MERVREYRYGQTVLLEKRADDGRLVVVAQRYSDRVEIDLFDILVWLHSSGLAQLRLATPEETQS